MEYTQDSFMSDDAIKKLLKSLHIQKGGVPGISKDAPANDSYYLRCEHMEYETEVESLHLTNYDEEVKILLQHIREYIDKKIIGEGKHLANGAWCQNVEDLRAEQRKLNQEEKGE